MVNNILERYVEIVEKICENEHPTIITYGSNLHGDMKSDLDICVLLDEPENVRKKLIKETVCFFKREKLPLDKEIPYERKLTYSYQEVDEILSDNIFLFFDNILCLDIDKNKEFLNSNYMRDRLLINIFTSLHKVVAGDDIYVDLCEKKAWEIILEMIVYYFNLSSDIPIENYLSYLFKNAKTNKSGEEYLGYKQDSGVKDQYLLSMLKKNVPLFLAKVVNLAENINPYYPNIKMQRRIADMIWDVSKYPENTDRRLKKRIANIYGLDEDNIIVTNGAMEAIHLSVFECVTEKNVIMQPTFWGYEDQLRKLGKKYTNFWEVDNNIEKTLERVCMENKHVFLCNPNNPYYRYIPKDVIERILENNKQCTLIIDESLLAFEDDYLNKTLIHSIDKYPNLIVLMSLSKISSLCGLRIGFIVAHPNVVARLQGYHTPYAIGTISQMAALDFFDDIILDVWNRKKIKKNFEWFKKEFSDKEKYTIEVCGNSYMVIKCNDDVDINSLCEYLQSNQIEVRNLLQSYPQINKKWIRVSAGKRSDFLIFGKKLREYFERKNDGNENF